MKKSDIIPPVSSDPLLSGPVIRFRTNRGTIVNESRLTLLSDGPSRHILVGMTDRRIEVPADSGLIDHLIEVARRGGPVYLTRDGEIVGAFVNRDVAESVAQDQEDDVDEHDSLSPTERLDLLAEELERSNGPVTQQELDEADRQWRAALGR